MAFAELGQQFAGKVCFLTTADIQATLPSGDPDKVRAEVGELIEHWSTPQGGFIVFNYGDPEALGRTARDDRDHVSRLCRAYVPVKSTYLPGTLQSAWQVIPNTQKETEHNDDNTQDSVHRPPERLRGLVHARVRPSAARTGRGDFSRPGQDVLGGSGRVDPRL